MSRRGVNELIVRVIQEAHHSVVVVTGIDRSIPLVIGSIDKLPAGHVCNSILDAIEGLITAGGGEPAVLFDTREEFDV